MTIPKRLLPLYLVSRNHHKSRLGSEGRRCCIEQLEDRRLLATNLPPVNMVGGPEEVLVNTPLAFTEFRNNHWSVDDPDVGANKLRVTLTAAHGTISLLYPDPFGGITYTTGDGTDDVTMEFTGTLTDINAAYEWVVFRPEQDYVGTEASITVTTNDQGFVGIGGPQEDTDVIPITVTQVPVPAFDPSPTWETLPAALDASFDGDGKMILSVSSGVDRINKLLPLEDGKILAVGAVNDHFGLMRFNPDLTLDSTFGAAGVVESDFGNGQHALTITQHPDGNFLVGGGNGFAKYSTAGVLVTAFGNNGKVDGPRIDAIGVRADGQIVVTGGGFHGGEAHHYDADGVFLRASDSVDAFVGALNLVDDGTLVITGGWNHWHHSNDYIHMTTNRWNVIGQDLGTITNDFGDGHHVYSGLKLPDGDFLAVGQVNNRIMVNRHNPSGPLDTSFDGDGHVELPVLGTHDIGWGASLQPDGKILIAGQAYNGVNWDFAIARLNYDGSLDPTFIFSGSSAIAVDFGTDDEAAFDILALPDGKILVAGHAGNDIALVRLLGDSDIVPPTAALALPTDGCSIDIESLNERGYLNVSFNDVGGSGFDPDSVTDVENELILSGTAAADVTLDGTAALVSGSTYQYTFTGTFGAGPVTVEFDAGTFADQYGNANESAMASFTVVNQSQSVSGDFDQDCHVDGRDFLAWQRGFGLLAPNATRADGDANNDTAVDDADLTIWEGQYGLAEPLAALGALAAGESASIEPAPLGIAASEASSPVIASSPSNTNLVDVALAVALKEEADTVFGKREFVEQASPLEYFSAEPIGRADLRPSFSIAGKPASSATSTQEGESPETPSSWEEAFDEVFASVL